MSGNWLRASVRDPGAAPAPWLSSSVRVAKPSLQLRNGWLQTIYQHQHLENKGESALDMSLQTKGYVVVSCCLVLSTMAIS